MKNIILTMSLLFTCSITFANTNTADNACLQMGGLVNQDHCQIDEWSFYFQLIEMKKAIPSTLLPQNGQSTASLVCEQSGGYVQYTETESGMVGTCIMQLLTLEQLLTK